MPAAVVFDCGVCCCIAEIARKKQEKSSTEKQSSTIIVHKPKRTATSTRTIHTRQIKPYRLHTVPAGVLGARSRCCPAATVPAAVVIACGVDCCIAEITEKKQNKSSTEKQSSAIIVHKPTRTATSTRTTRTTQNNPYRFGAPPAGVIGARGRCCPAATVPAAVLLPCGVCSCIADIKQQKQTK